MTVWFRQDGSDVAVCTDDPHVLLIGDLTPDWVQLPDELPIPEFSGMRVRVLASVSGVCPVCKRPGVRHLMLEHQLGVAACQPGCGFLFYRVSVDTKETGNEE